jgi:hypothetical protein
MRPPHSGVLGETVIDPALDAAHFGRGEHRFNPSDFIVYADDAVPVRVKLSDARAIQLGRKFEPVACGSGDSAFDPGLFDTPDMRDLARPDRGAKGFETWAHLVAGRAQVVVNEHPHRASRPGLRGIRSTPLLLCLDAFPLAALVDGDPAVDPCGARHARMLLDIA